MHINIDTSIYEGESYYAGGAFQDTSGTYYDTIKVANDCDSVLKTNLIVESLNSFSKTELKYESKIFPNPTKHFLFIDMKHMDYAELYNSTGKLVHKTSNDFINFTRYKEGIYTLKIIDRNGNKFSFQVVYY